MFKFLTIPSKNRFVATLYNPRCLSTTKVLHEAKSCKLLIVGGGTAGCASAAKFARDFNDKHKIIIVEPANYHYYQPMFTLVGGGIKKLSDARKPTREVLPQQATWLKDEVVEFNPKGNEVITKNGHTIKYEFMIVACGINPNFDKIPGLMEGLSRPGGVCSNYSDKYVDKTFRAIQEFKYGNAIFTLPNTPIKCPGAPQKICYITDHYFRKHGKRDQAKIFYNTSLGVIFGVKKYADALWKVCRKRDITVNLRTNLIEIIPDQNKAVFQNLDRPDEKTEYSMLHVTPPMSTPEALHKNKDLTNDAGFVEVNKDTLRHVRFPNVFGMGDCSSSPNSKTAAAAAAQLPVVHNNLLAVMNGKTVNSVYDGYASCPLVTGYGTCILAEFDYDLNPLETFPISQDKEMYSMYALKKDLMPTLYWHLMLNGYWDGPARVRNIMHLNFY